MVDSLVVTEAGEGTKKLLPLRLLKTKFLRLGKKTLMAANFLDFFFFFYFIAWPGLYMCQAFT